MPLPGLPGVTLSAIQVSLHRLVRLLDVKGRSPGFDLSSAVVPIVDVTRVVELDGARPGYLTEAMRADSAPEFTAYGLASAAAGRGAVVQLFNPPASGVLVEVTGFRTHAFPAAGTQLRLFSAGAACSDNYSAEAGAAGQGGRPWPKRLAGVEAGSRAKAQLRGQEATIAVVPELRWHLNGVFVAQMDPLDWLSLAEGAWYLEPGADIAVLDASGAAGTRFATKVDWREWPMS